MEIRIIALRLRNFKGVRSAEYLFDGRNARIEGPNGSGKSTVFDAFTWLLFGKDHRGRESFEIKTIDPATGLPYPREDHWVEAVLSVDGRERVLRRAWVEEWVKPTGEVEDVMKGHKSAFFVDGVDVGTKRAYDAVVAGWLTEDTFKLLTNPLYFIDESYTGWKDRRRALLDLVKDAPERARVREEFADVVDRLSGRSIEDYRKRIALEKAANKRDLGLVLGRIEGMREALPEEVDTAAVAARLDQLRARRDKAVGELRKEAETIDRAIASADEADAARKAENAAIWAEITQSQLDMERCLSEAKKAAQGQNNARNEAILQAQKKANDAVLACSTIKGEEKRLRADLAEAEANRGKLAADLAELGERYKAEKARAFDFVAETTCPYCGQEIPAATVEQAVEKAREAFLAKQKEVVDGIITTARGVKRTIAELDDAMAALRDKVFQVAERYDLADAEAAKWKGERDRLERLPEVDLASIEAQARCSDEYKALSAKERELRARALKTGSRPEGVDDLVNRRREVERKIREEMDRFAKAELEAQDALSVGKVRAEQEELIRQKEREAKNFADALANCERLEARAAEYVKADVESVERSLAALFRTARWRMFDRTIDGAVVETCVVCDKDGTPYGSMNDAMKVLCGIDCIRVFSERYGNSAPIFVDNAEGILRDGFDTRAQVIRLVVKDVERLNLVIE